MTMFAQCTRPNGKTRNFESANDNRFDRELSRLRDLANQYQPAFSQSDFHVKLICDAALYGDREIICDRSWRDWKKRLGIAVSATGFHDAGSFFLLRLTAKYKKRFGIKSPLTKQALIEFAKTQEQLDSVSADVIKDPDYAFPGSLFPAIAYHLTGLHLSESYLYCLFRTRLNIQFGRHNQYTVKQASVLMCKFGYTLLSKQKEKLSETQKILDAIFKESDSI